MKRTYTKKLWTQAEETQLRERYPHARTSDLAEIMGCSTEEIYSKAGKMGLRKTAEFLASPASGRTTGRQGIGTRFVKGQISWNKGTHFVAGGRSAQTRFKKGGIPKNWKPIGSERISDGYLQRKMTDTGYPPKDWVGVHIIVWVSHNGPVPKGHAVVFKDGDKRHITIDNLDMISRRDLMLRNTIHHLPEDLKQVIRLNGVIRRKINGK